MDRAIILVDPERFTEVHSAITSTVKSAQPLLASPFYIAAVGDPGLEQVKAVPGVVDVTIANDQQLGLLDGIDRAIGLCLGLVDDWSVGGVTLGGQYPASFGEPQGNAAPSAVCAAVNLSLTPAEDDVAPTSPGDIVNHATRTLSTFSVPVVAAGNHHTPGVSYETVSPWAEPDWVLSVGATQDEAGQVEWPHSGRGSATNPGVGPDVLAWGQDAMSSDGFGTSFAAARVSSMVVLVRAWLWQIAANLDRLAGRTFGVPLIGCAIVDERFASQPPDPPAFDWPALPIIATAGDPLAHLPPEMRQEVGLSLAGAPSVRAARILVEAAAKATSPAAAGQLSAPSITVERLKGFLDGLSGPALHQLLAVDKMAHGQPGADLPIFRAGCADRLWDLILATMPIWQWDIDTQTPRMRHRKEGQT